MTRAKYKSKAPYRLVTFVLIGLPAVVAVLSGFLTFLWSEPPRGPLGALYRFLWEEWPRWTHLVTFLVAVVLVLVADWIRDRLGPSEEPVEATIDRLSKALAAADLHNRWLESIKDEAMERAAILAAKWGPDGETVAEKYRDAQTFEKLNDLGLRMVRGATRNYRSRFRELERLLLCSIPSMKVQLNEIAELYQSNLKFPDDPAGDPILWLICYALTISSDAIVSTHVIESDTLVPSIIREEKLKNPAITWEELQDILLRRLAELTHLEAPTAGTPQGIGESWLAG